MCVWVQQRGRRHGRELLRDRCCKRRAQAVLCISGCSKDNLPGCNNISGHARHEGREHRHPCPMASCCDEAHAAAGMPRCRSTHLGVAPDYLVGGDVHALGHAHQHLGNSIQQLHAEEDICARLRHHHGVHGVDQAVRHAIPSLHRRQLPSPKAGWVVAGAAGREGQEG